MRHKIRVWDKQKNRMVGQQWLIPGDRLEVLRLSGARDKNETDIGEEDIILYGKTKYLVFYNEHRLRWMIGELEPSEKAYQSTFDNDMASHFEVIGNLLQEEENDRKTK